MANIFGDFKQKITKFIRDADEAHLNEVFSCMQTIGVLYNSIMYFIENQNI
jgi:hypothetical protein